LPSIFIRLNDICAALGQLRQHNEIIQREPGEAAAASHGTAAVATAAVATAAATIHAIAWNASFRAAISLSRGIPSTYVSHS